jgi:CheY-like chemotaxis protein
LRSEAPTKRVLIVDSDEIVAFIASHILSRYDFAVQTANTAGALSTGPDGFDAIVVSDQIAAELASSLDMSRVVILGDGVNGLKPFAHLRKPLELDQLVRTVTSCANNRQ